jgi:NAD(P)-dependent dehydrogenase (short-subunit alcohol dehydrogenase family)
MSTHPAFAAGRTAVITGGASGIGLAAAQRFASFGMKVCIADLPGETLDRAKQDLAASSKAGSDSVIAVPTDVSDAAAVAKLRDAAYSAFGEVAVLINNAGIGSGGGPWEKPDRWRRVLEVNLWGVINGVQSFTQAMLDQNTPAMIINTGSKQGITCPPGDTAYNVSKAGIKVLTEALAHSLRKVEGGQVTAHLLIPGSTFTGLTTSRTKPPGAWLPGQVVDFMLTSIDNGDFYILCPDNDVPRELDERRMLWAAQDIIQNRPPLSRWHKDYAEKFAAFLKVEKPPGL